MTLVETIQELSRQLSWRGPTGKPQGHIVLDRDVAQEIHDALVEMLNNALDVIEADGQA